MTLVAIKSAVLINKRSYASRSTGEVLTHTVAVSCPSFNHPAKCVSLQHFRSCVDS